MIDARLKSLFVMPAGAATLAMAGVSAAMALRGGHQSLAWCGASLAALPLPVVLGNLMWRSVARTSDTLPLALLLSAAGLGISAWEVLMERAAGWPPLITAVAGTLILILYVFWYSRFGRPPNPKIAVGEKLPPFELHDADGNPVRSQELAGRPTVLLFFRGNWCPLCMAQIREIADRYRELADMGVDVLLVSPQPAERTRELAARLDVPLRVLVDEGNRVAAELDIEVRNGVPLGAGAGYEPDTVLPTLIVTNASGTIVFSDQTDNYRIRPEPDTFIAILRRAGAM